jgi:hypothetical protein
MNIIKHVERRIVQIVLGVVLLFVAYQLAALMIGGMPPAWR